MICFHLPKQPIAATDSGIFWQRWRVDEFDVGLEVRSLNSSSIYGASFARTVDGQICASGEVLPEHRALVFSLVPLSATRYGDLRSRSRGRS